MDRAQSITTIDALGDRRRTPKAFLLLLSAPVLVTKAKSEQVLRPRVSTQREA
jgi:hypothetical protein